MKLVAITATVAAFAFTGSANACNDMGFASKMSVSGNYAVRSMQAIGKANFVSGKRYIMRAQDAYISAPLPCAATLKTASTQYGYALDYVEQGLDHAINGRYALAITAIKRGIVWVQKATLSVRRFNNN